MRFVGEGPHWAPPVSANVTISNSVRANVLFLCVLHWFGLFCVAICLALQSCALFHTGRLFHFFLSENYSIRFFSGNLYLNSLVTKAKAAFHTSQGMQGMRQTEASWNVWIGISTRFQRKKAAAREDWTHDSWLTRQVIYHYPTTTVGYAIS